ALKRLGSSLHSPLRINKKSTNWCDKPKYFWDSRKCEIKPGNIILSPCKFPSGHRVSSKPGPFGSLIEGGSVGQAFLREILEFMALMGSHLALVSPDLFKHQLRLLKAMINALANKFTRPNVMKELLCLWPSPFSRVAVISNRETILHRDMQGGQNLCDILSTVGQYEDGRFEVSLLGLQSVYNLGCMIALLGFALQHGAAKVNGERVSFAGF
ncbi:hypothetical protein FA15DRAFT_564839, partial [Coprinopsis marcescibilis]